MDRDPGDSYPESFTASYPPQLETTDDYVIIQSIRDDFKLMISKVSSSLSKVDIDRIRYLCTVSLPTDQDTESSALKLLELLEQKGTYSHTNIKPLEELLRKVERCDLISEYIEPYKRKLNSSDYTTVSQTGTPNQPTRTPLSSQPKLIPQDTRPKPVYSNPVEESVISRGDTIGENSCIVSGTFERETSTSYSHSQHNLPGDDIGSVTSKSELVLSRSSHAMDSLTQRSLYGASSVRNKPQESPEIVNQCLQETQTSPICEEIASDAQSNKKLFSMASSTSIPQLQKELPQTLSPQVPSLPQSSNPPTRPGQTVPRELYNLELLPPGPVESPNELQQQKSPTCTSDETVVNSSGSSTDKTATPTPSNEASTSVLASGTSTGATATTHAPDSVLTLQEDSGNCLKCCPSTLQIKRKQMGTKVLNHQHNSCFKHKFRFPIDKKRCSLLIKAEIYSCGLGEDGEGDDRYSSIKAIVTPSNVDHLLLFYKCAIKLIIQVSLVDSSGSSQDINEVSGEVFLERGRKEFFLIVSKVLSHNQIIHGENKYFEFQFRAELSHEELVDFVTKDIEDDFVSIESVTDLKV